MKFENITSLIDYNEFEKIKKFILKNGDKMTYRNFDNNNPHYRFENCDIFLGADKGNIDNNPEISDFNQLTIRDWESDIMYYEVVIVRKGDLEEGKLWLREGMEEEQVYLVDVHDKRLEMMHNLSKYLEQIRKKIKATKGIDS